MSYFAASDFLQSKASEELMEISEGTKKDKHFDKTGRNKPVNELRTRLHKDGFDVDGSKEMLVSRLEANKKHKTK